MNGLIRTKQELCTGCNRCVRECPMEMANITYKTGEGEIKVKVNHDKCITCGHCFSVCKHNARYYEDDTLRFFDDLAKGVPVSVIAAPSVHTNIPEYKRLFTYLKNLGVRKIYDVSLGADICTWAHIRYIEKNGAVPLITQPCPVIVSYCEIYKHELLDKLSPIHSPMACAAVYMKKCDGIADSIAALSPCIAKSNEFSETGLAQYNVTFAKLQQYIEQNNIVLPLAETEFDHHESGMGSIYPMPGGLKENIDFYFGNEVYVSKAEGHGIYNKLDTYARTSGELLPDIFDVLNCNEGCNIGSAVSCEKNIFEIGLKMKERRDAAAGNAGREYCKKMYERYDGMLDISWFMRKYLKTETPFPEITEHDIEKAFELLGKSGYEKQHVDCGACGSATCYNMARKIALGVNIPTNCIVNVMETAKAEHEQVSKMEKLREADVRMQVLLNANPNVNMIFSDEFKIIDCNPAAVKFMGFETKDEMISGFVAKLTKSIPEFQSDGRASVPLSERFMTVIREGSVKFETDIVLDGIPMSFEAEFRKIPYGDSFAIAGYVYDLTDIHKREVELKRTREQLTAAVKDAEAANEEKSEFLSAMHTAAAQTEAVLSNYGGLIWSVDRDMTITLFNGMILKKLGVPPSMFEGKNVSVATARGRHIDISERIKKTFTDGVQDWVNEIDGAYFHHHTTPVLDSDGTVICVVGSSEDISDVIRLQKDLEKAVEEANAASRAKSNFLSAMSHEIRTPMNAILGITEIQLQNETIDSGLRESLDKIYVSGDMLLGIINDILDLSKIESGKLELLIDNYEIASLISDTTQLNIMRIGSKPIEFELQVDEHLPSKVLGDELRVKQILNNILSNAFKYTAAGKVKLTVAAEPEPEGENGGGNVTLVITVSDTGQGMTKEQVDKLFDEYTRFNLEANRATEGTGLGMNITKNLLNLMNGKIFVESEPGKGSAFTVRIPQGRGGPNVLGREIAENLQQFRSSNRAQMKRVQVTRESMPYGSVLIVDDVETNIYVAKGLMMPYDLKIDSADSGYAAIEKIKSGSTYDIVFMDHMMPKMDGVETTKILRSMGYKGSIVALTANAVIGQADLFLNNGFDDFISKPIDIRQLNSVLNKLIRDKQPADVIGAARQSETRQNAREQKKDMAQTPESASQNPVSAQIAAAFARDALKAMAELESTVKKGKDLDAGDMRIYTIHVHGMKSALANIGMGELSAAAFELETAGRNGDIETVSDKTPAFLESLRRIVDGITVTVNTGNEELCGAETEDEDLPFLRGKLIALRAACEVYDKKTARSIIAELKEKTWSEATGNLLEKASGQLLHSDFDEVINAVDGFCDAE